MPRTPHLSCTLQVLLADDTSTSTPRSCHAHHEHEQTTSTSTPRARHAHHFFCQMLYILCPPVSQSPKPPMRQPKSAWNNGCWYTTHTTPVIDDTSTGTPRARHAHHEREQTTSTSAPRAHHAHHKHKRTTSTPHTARAQANHEQTTSTPHTHHQHEQTMSTPHTPHTPRARENPEHTT